MNTWVDPLLGLPVTGDGRELIVEFVRDRWGEKGELEATQ